MTIAMCYVSPEGIVLGADSTSSLMTQPGIFHFFNHNQKLFELGEKSSIGVLTWGLGGLSGTSHRLQLSQLAEDAKQNPPTTFNDLVSRWCAQFGALYDADPLIVQLMGLWNVLAGKLPFDPNAEQPLPNSRSKEEQQTYINIANNITVGFCFAGHFGPSRIPCAAYTTFGPLSPSRSPVAIPLNSYAFWGVPNMIKRLIWGYDEGLEESIKASGKWKGTDGELRNLLELKKLDHAVLPLRDAIDFVHTCIYSTIKAMKFSNQAQVCGGPIEIAVISVDRDFRWVKHKSWKAAILEGEDSRHDRRYA